MCFAPQRRALFRHRNFQKWFEAGVLCTFWLWNVLRAATGCTFSTSQLPKVVRAWCALYILTWKCATTACAFSSLIWPAGSAPAKASLLSDTPEPQIIGKTQCFATFLPFRAPGSSFFWDFLFLFLFSSLLFSSLLWLFPSLLFICPYCRKLDFSKLPLANIWSLYVKFGIHFATWAKFSDRKTPLQAEIAFCGSGSPSSRIRRRVWAQLGLRDVESCFPCRKGLRFGMFWQGQVKEELLIYDDVCWFQADVRWFATMRWLIFPSLPYVARCRHDILAWYHGQHWTGSAPQHMVDIYVLQLYTFYTHGHVLLSFRHHCR